MFKSVNPVKFVLSAVLSMAVLGSVPARAADDVFMMPVKPALETPNAKEKLDGSVSFYFGDTPHPKVLENYGEFVSNKKTNAFAKSDAETCQHVVLSNFIEFQERAQSLGGNAVINIKSYFRRNEVKDDSRYECHVGFLMSGVALKGEVVKLAE
ncbi:hypothetical protein [Parvibaculum sp.]|jgi:uncharacterized protein YbjQ (UPF0145 family)|uniref:hypothetical protein n=1 Tax=Parvibaculum sp. TaxID=2024848 RepID=UPI002FD882E6